AGAPGRAPRRRLAACTQGLLAGSAARDVLLRPARLAGAAVPENRCPARRLVPARRIPAVVPGWLPGRAQCGGLGRSRPVAPPYPGDCGAGDLDRAPAARRRPLPAGRPYPGTAGRAPLAPHRAGGTRALHVVGTAGHLRMGAHPAGPPVRLAALRDRGGVSVVRVAPEPDRAA